MGWAQLIKEEEKRGESEGNDSFAPGYNKNDERVWRCNK